MAAFSLPFADRLDACSDNFCDESRRIDDKPDAEALQIRTDIQTALTN